MFTSNVSSQSRMPLLDWSQGHVVTTTSPGPGSYNTPLASSAQESYVQDCVAAMYYRSYSKLSVLVSVRITSLTDVSHSINTKLLNYGCDVTLPFISEIYCSSHCTATLIQATEITKLPSNLRQDHP